MLRAVIYLLIVENSYDAMGRWDQAHAVRKSVIRYIMNTALLEMIVEEPLKYDPLKQSKEKTNYTGKK